MSYDYNKVVLIGDGRRDEAYAGDTIKPGHMIALASTGKVAVHAKAGGEAETMFAVEAPLNQGKTINDSYAANDLVFTYHAKKGDVIGGWLKAGESVVPGDYLVSDGAGGFQKAPAYLTDIANIALTSLYVKKAVALDTLDLSAGGSVATRLRIRIL